MANETANADQTLTTIQQGFSREDIWHAARFWGVSDEQALRQLIEEEKRFAEDDRATFACSKCEGAGGNPATEDRHGRRQICEHCDGTGEEPRS